MNVDDLRGIKVEVQNDIDVYDHVGITVRSVTSEMLDGLPDDVPNSVVWEANIETAGVIARLATFAYPFLLEARHRHQCSGVSWSPNKAALNAPVLTGCEITSGLSLLFPGQDFGDCPGIQLIVPRERADTWLEWISVWLESMALDIERLEVVRGKEARLAHPDPNVVDIDSGWTPGGDCEHQAGGLDRGPMSKKLRCLVCRHDESSRAKARAMTHCDAR